MRESHPWLIGCHPNCCGAKVEAFYFSFPGNDVFASESDHLNVDILSTTQRSLCRCPPPHISTRLYMHTAQLCTLYILDVLFHCKIVQKAHCSAYFSPSPLLFFFRLAMECMIRGLRGPTMWNIMTELLPGMAPFSLNLILAVLKIVCIPGRTDRPLFSQSLLRPGC